MSWFLNIVHHLADPFIFLAFLLNLFSVNIKARKYRRDKSLIAPEDRYKLVYKIVKKVLYLRNLKYEAKSFEFLTKKPSLIVANHKSNVDVFLLIKTLFEIEGLPWFSFVAKKEFTKSKILKNIMDLIDTVYIDRNSLRQQYEAFNQQNELVKQNHSIIVFPEGTRVYGDKIQEFLPGAFKVAYQNFLAIVPIAIFGSSGKLFDFKCPKKERSKAKKVILECLKPINHNQYIQVNEIYKAKQIQDLITSKYEALKKLQNK